MKSFVNYLVGICKLQGTKLYLPCCWGLTNSVGNPPTEHYTMINKMKSSDNVQIQQPGSTQLDISGHNLFPRHPQTSDTEKSDCQVEDKYAVCFLETTAKEKNQDTNTESPNLSHFFRKPSNSFSSESSYNSFEDFDGDDEMACVDKFGNDTIQNSNSSKKQKQVKFKDDVDVVTFETFEDGSSLVTGQYTTPLKDNSESDFDLWLLDNKMPFSFNFRGKY